MTAKVEISVHKSCGHVLTALLLDNDGNEQQRHEFDCDAIQASAEFNVHEGAHLVICEGSVLPAGGESSELKIAHNRVAELSDSESRVKAELHLAQQKIAELEAAAVSSAKLSEQIAKTSTEQLSAALEELTASQKRIAELEAAAKVKRK